VVVEAVVTTSSVDFVAGVQGDAVEGAGEEEGLGGKLELLQVAMSRKRSKNRPSSRVRCATRTIAARRAIKFTYNRIKRCASFMPVYIPVLPDT
jgi:hypothetical protein